MMNTEEMGNALSGRLSRENAALHSRVNAAAVRLSELEKQVFALQHALEQPAAPKDVVSDVWEGAPQPQDIERLTRENVSLRARLDYCTRVVDIIEESLLHLSDVMQHT